MYIYRIEINTNDYVKYKLTMRIKKLNYSLWFWWFWWFLVKVPGMHVWRSMPNHGMTPHTSGTSLTAQSRYADGVREILECFFDGKEIRNQYLIVKDGQLAGMGAHSYSKGSATGGSEEAAKYKKK